MNIDKEKVKKLLGNGLTPTLVATTVGCDPSYISQLMAEDSFALEVAQLRCNNYEAVITRDQKYDTLEDQLLQKLEDLMPLMMKPRDVLDALTRINAAKRRGSTVIPTNDEVHSQVIQLQLPNVVLQQFIVNGTAEVVQVGQRALTNLPAATLMKSLEERSAESASKEQSLPRLTAKQAERSVFTEDSV